MGVKPVDQRLSMIQKNGIWVHLGKLPKGFDWETLVDEVRDDRIKELSGL
jgi:hypothetical protein